MTILKDTLANICDDLEIYCRVELDSDGIYLGTLRASLMRSYQFCCYAIAKKDTEQLFYSSAALRALCEDLISITFFGKLPREQRDLAIQAILEIEFHNMARKQEQFFRKQRPFQPVIGIKDDYIEKPHSVLEQVAHQSGLWTYSKARPTPTVRDRAKKIGYDHLYQFYYALTSEFVHFSPRMLMRMGWGEDPCKPSFSSTNFSSYYGDVARLYGVYLFITMANEFAGVDETVPRNLLKATNRLKETIDAEVRWPEAVTFEELNIRGPTYSSRLMAKAAFELVSKC